MSARAAPRIRRGGSATRRPAARARKPAPRRSGLAADMDRALSALPVPAGVFRRIGNGLLVLILLGGLVAGLIAMRLPQMVGVELAEAIGRAGFEVRNVEIVGREHVDRDAVYRITMDARGQPMPLVDLEGVRAKLLGLGWIEDARVSRRLPDTMVVDLVERRPAAIWQYRRRLTLIDEAGHEIAPVDALTMPDRLPLVIGPGANRQAAALAALVATQPALKPLVEGATWIGNRRWDVRFQSGETLALPEGDGPARAALAYFAKRDSQVRLLGQGYVRFDMRDPARMVVRMSSEPGLKIADGPAAEKSI